MRKDTGLSIIKRIGGLITLNALRFFEGCLLKRQIEKLYLVMGGHIFFETLSAAVEFDLFTQLSKHPGMTRSQIASALGAEEKPIRILLLGCVSLGLIHKKGNAYYNSRLANRLLVSDNPKNIIAVIRWQHHINYKPMHAFYDAIKANTNVGLKEFSGDEPFLYGRLTHHPDLELIFQQAMQGISVQANALLAQFVDLSGVQHLIDVGGGNATNIINLARHNPHLRASVFDSPSVCKIARDNIEKASLQDRLGATEGDCFKTPFPTDADCILFCHFMTIWSEADNLTLLKKAHDALPPGGKAIVFNMMQADNEDGPLSAAMGSPYFLTLATGQGMLYTWREYETWMRQAGFTQVKTQTLIRDHGAIIGVKG